MRQYHFSRSILLLVLAAALLLAGCSTPAVANLPAQNLPETPAPSPAATLPSGGSEDSNIAASPEAPETVAGQRFVNEEHGYQMDLPEGFELYQPNLNEMFILAPQGTGGHRERAIITVTPANGRTAEQVMAEFKTDQIPEVAAQPVKELNLDTETALVLDRVPSQDLMRVLFVVHEDRLYQMLFFPQDEGQGEAYIQMSELYEAFAETFQFIPVVDTRPTNPYSSKLVTEPDVFTNLLQQSLRERDKVALQSMMGDIFNLTFWGLTPESEWLNYSEAVDTILNDYVPEGAQPVLDANHPIIQRYFTAQITNGFGEELMPVHVSGWGLEGKDEAILFIARRADGSLYWFRVMTAREGFPE